MIIIPKTKLLNPAGGTPLTNPANAGAVHQAAAQVGEQISQIGESAFGHQVQLQRIRNDNDLANKQADLRTMLGDFDNTLPTDHDPSTWVQRREKFINDAVAKLGVDQLPPEARNKWDRWYVDYSTDSQLKTARDATVYGIQLAKRDGQLRHEKYMASGDFELARENALRMRDNGTIAPQAADEVLYAIDREEEIYTVDLLLRDAPEALTNKEFLDSLGTLSELDRSSILSKARRAEKKQEADELRSIIEAREAGELRTVRELEERILNSPRISEETGKKFISEYRRNVPMSGDEKLMMLDDISGLRQDRESGLSDDEFFRRYYSLESEIMARAGGKSSVLYNTLAKLVSPEKEGDHPKMEQINARVDYLFEGDPDKGGDINLVRKNSVSQEMKNWLRSNSTASDEQIEEEIQKARVRSFSKDYTKTIQSTHASSRQAILNRKGMFHRGEVMSIYKVNATKLPIRMRHLAPLYQQYGEQYGVNPIFLAAVSILETGRGTSGAYQTGNNAMGISDKEGPVKFGKVEDSIKKMAEILGSKDGVYKGAYTVEDIGAIFSPVGAENDYNGTNHNWAYNVISLMQGMGVNDASTLEVVKR